MAGGCIFAEETTGRGWYERRKGKVEEVPLAPLWRGVLGVLLGGREVSEELVFGSKRSVRGWGGGKKMRRAGRPTAAEHGWLVLKICFCSGRAVGLIDGF